MRILIVGPSWVGDMVMAQTLFQCLRQRHPECVIDVLAPEWSRPILERMPEVRQALSFPLGHGVMDVATRRRIGRGLRGQYEQAILLPNSLKSALVPWFAKVPRRIGWHVTARFGLLNDGRRPESGRLHGRNGFPIFAVLRQIPQKDVRIADNARQDIVQVVGNTAGQSSDGLHFLGPGQPFFQFQPLVVGMELPGYVLVSA